MPPKEKEKIVVPNLNDEQRQLLIDTVHSYEVLWNKKINGYRDAGATMQAWAAVGEVMELSGKLILGHTYTHTLRHIYTRAHTHTHLDAYTHTHAHTCKCNFVEPIVGPQTREAWNRLRDYYRDHFGPSVQPKSGSAGGAGKEWKFAKSLEFLNDVFEPRKLVLSNYKKVDVIP